ncbi:MAG: hypothetical protein IPP72_22280 [Chitinophagaceae bacterium]|nr:hypothetical protein [Chitinophagaceae bacterium]
MKAIINFLISNRRKHFVAMALSLFLTTASNAGNIVVLHHPEVLNLDATSHPTAEWVLDKTVSNVDFYHSITACNGKNVVFLKFVNRNSQSVKISWQEIFVTSGRERREGFAGRKEMLIPTGTTTPADCADVASKKIIIRGGEVDPMSVVEIINFIYKDVTVAL